MWPAYQSHQRLNTELMDVKDGLLVKSCVSFSSRFSTKPTCQSSKYHTIKEKVRSTSGCNNLHDIVCVKSPHCLHFEDVKVIKRTHIPDSYLRGKCIGCSMQFSYLLHQFTLLRSELPSLQRRPWDHQRLNGGRFPSLTIHNSKWIIHKCVVSKTPDQSKCMTLSPRGIA